MQAAEEEERRAKKEAQRETAQPPAERVRAVLQSGEVTAAVDLLNGMKVDSGIAQRMSYLLEVWPTAQPVILLQSLHACPIEAPVFSIMTLSSFENPQFHKL